MPWERVVKKFRSLLPRSMPKGLGDKIITAVEQLEEIGTAELMKLLCRVAS